MVLEVREPESLEAPSPFSSWQLCGAATDTTRLLWDVDPLGSCPDKFNFKILAFKWENCLLLARLKLATREYGSPGRSFAPSRRNLSCGRCLLMSQAGAQARNNSAPSELKRPQGSQLQRKGSALAPSRTELVSPFLQPPGPYPKGTLSPMTRVDRIGSLRKIGDRSRENTQETIETMGFPEVG